MQIIRTRKRLMAAAAVAAAALTAASLAGMGAAGAATNLGHRPHPHYAGANVTGTVHFVNDQFQGNIGGFCGASPPNAPCDGNAMAGDYGTIDSVSSKFSNGGFGNYAPSTKSLDGSQMALVSGTTAANQGQPCPTPGTEGCTGPYWVPTSAETVFPTGGFTVTADVYLDKNAPVGEIDPDVAMSTSSGSYGQDMIFAACSAGAGSGWTITAGHNSPGSCSGTPVVTTSGWYRFVWLFTNVGGKVYLTQRVIAESGHAVVFDSGAQGVQFPGDSSIETTATAGGIHYFWLPTEDYSGVPFQNYAVQLGQHQSGHTP
jgi:hypothetical protein